MADVSSPGPPEVTPRVWECFSCARRYVHMPESLRCKCKAQNWKIVPEDAPRVHGDGCAFGPAWRAYLARAGGGVHAGMAVPSTCTCVLGVDSPQESG